MFVRPSNIKIEVFNAVVDVKMLGCD